MGFFFRRKKQIILGIHGLGNKPPQDTLTLWWLNSMREGLQRIGKTRLHIPFELVYWADVLYDKPFDPSITDPAHALFNAEPYMEVKPGQAVRPVTFRKKIMRFIESRLDKIFLKNDMTLNFEGLTNKIINKYFHDLETYFGDRLNPAQTPYDSDKELIRKRLIDVLTRYRKYEIMVIGHSMGSIITYDVLIQYPQIPEVHTLVTMGSPLGLPVIVSRIFLELKKFKPGIKKPPAPGKVSYKWYNISDEDDNVALDHSISTDYERNEKGINVEDINVCNDYEINGESNPHKVYGYLRTPEFASILDQFLIEEKRNIFYIGFKSIQDSLQRAAGKIQKIFRGKNRGGQPPVL